MKKMMLLFVVLFSFMSMNGQTENVVENGVGTLNDVGLTSFRVLVQLEFKCGRRISLLYELDYSKEGDKTLVGYGVMALPKGKQWAFLKKYESGSFVCTGKDNALDKFLRIFLNDPDVKDAYIVMKPQK